MVSNVASKRVGDLMKLLEGLYEIQGQLIELTRAKMDAMKTADVRRLQELHVEEYAVAKRLQARDGLRQALISGIAEDMGLAKTDAATLTVSRIAKRLPEPLGEQLTDVAKRLREAVAQAAQANRVVGVVSRETVNHLQWVFAAVRPKGSEPAGYSGSGTMNGSSHTQIFETTG